MVVLSRELDLLILGRVWRSRVTCLEGYDTNVEVFADIPPALQCQCEEQLEVHAIPWLVQYVYL